MQRRATIARSWSSVTRTKMNAFGIFVLCCAVGRVVGYEARREVPYNVGPNDPYTVEISPNYQQEQSQRLFWSNQGSNQVGGTGFWAHLTNKFPILGNMFGRMELPTQYGVPNQYELSTQYGAPGRFQQQNYQQSQYYQQPQFYQQPQNYQQQLPINQQQFGQRFVPSARDVGLTDDAVIVTPPFVPVNQPVAPAPAPIPVPIPAPVPIPQPAPTLDPSQGYSYEKPRFRLDLPLK